jgi:penicillin-binding protein 1B
VGKVVRVIGVGAVALVAAAAVTGGAAFTSLNERVSAAFSRDGGGVRLFSAPFRIRPGIDVETAGLPNRFLRLDYRPTNEGVPVPGTFRMDEGSLEIGIRGFGDGAREQAPGRFRVELAGTVVRRIAAEPGGAEVDEVWLEPEPIGRDGGGDLGTIRPVRLDALPPHVVQAVLAAEDVRFASHPGIDPIGIVRAAWANFRAGDIRQGGSTITQQLVKNMMLDAGRTWRRKIEEALLAVVIDFRFAKQEILQTYLDTVYMGRVGSLPVRGLTQASRGFFAKEPEALTVAEAATLAGIIRAPNANSPIRHPERARARRDQVLALMAEHGWIDAAELARSTAAPVEVRHRDPLEAPYFVAEVARELEALGIDRARDLAVFTTLDLELQRAAEEAVAAELAALERRHPKLRRPARPVEAAAVVVEARTGAIVALIGGRDRSRSEFDHAVRARRQPGSAFKPFVYLAAVDAPDSPLTPASLLLDQPFRLRENGRVWRPKNSDGRYLGRLTVRQALEQSRNVPAYHVGETVGRGRVRDLAANAGLAELPDVPSLPLGTGEVTLLDLTAAYGVFPNLGEFLPPTAIRALRGPGGAPLDRPSRFVRRVAGAAPTYVVSHLLEGVVDRGTAKDVRRLGLDAPLAGKTGTTDEQRDAWFVGYSPDYVVGVWVGFDDGRSLGLNAAGAAIPVWVAIMRRILDAYGTAHFPVPAGVVFRDVDRRSGLLATAACPDSVHEAFVSGTEPTRTCEAPVARARRAREGPSFWDGVGSFFRGLVGAD